MPSGSSPCSSTTGQPFCSSDALLSPSENMLRKIGDASASVLLWTRNCFKPTFTMIFPSLFQGSDITVSITACRMLRSKVQNSHTRCCGQGSCSLGPAAANKCDPSFYHVAEFDLLLYFFCPVRVAPILKASTESKLF